MHSSLSSFLRSSTESHFEGPIPAIEKDRIAIIEAAERAYDRSLLPIERASKALAHAYGEVLQDSALVQAATEMKHEGHDCDRLLAHRQAMLRESLTWLMCKAEEMKSAL